LSVTGRAMSLEGRVEIGSIAPKAIEIMGIVPNRANTAIFKLTLG
jgi:hypothetical protein